MPLSEHQNKLVHCGMCNAKAIWSEDDQKIITDWDITYADDPCSDGCHVPEQFMADEIDPIMDKIDEIIDRIGQTGSFLRAVEETEARKAQRKLTGYLGE